MLIASMAFIMPGPSMAATATASSTPGKGEDHIEAAHDDGADRSQHPAGGQAEGETDDGAGERIGTSAMGRETRPPQMTRLRMSRPWPSVPNGWPGVNGSARRPTALSASLGSKGLTSGAATVTATVSSTIAVPASARRSLDIASRASWSPERCRLAGCGSSAPGPEPAAAGPRAARVAHPPPPASSRRRGLSATVIRSVTRLASTKTTAKTSSTAWIMGTSRPRIALNISSPTPGH